MHQLNTGYFYNSSVSLYKLNIVYDASDGCKGGFLNDASILLANKIVSVFDCRLRLKHSLSLDSVSVPHHLSSDSVWMCKDSAAHFLSFISKKQKVLAEPVAGNTQQLLYHYQMTVDSFSVIVSVQITCVCVCAGVTQTKEGAALKMKCIWVKVLKKLIVNALE